MWSDLFFGAASGGAVLGAGLGIAVGTRAVASVLRTWIEQACRTRRLVKALEGSIPNQRPAIIIACSRLEAKPACEPDRALIEGLKPALGYAWPSRPLLPIRAAANTLGTQDAGSGFVRGALRKQAHCSPDQARD